MSDVVTGLAWLALVSGGLYAVLLTFGVLTHDAHPRERAGRLAAGCALVAIAGAAVLLAR